MRAESRPTPAQSRSNSTSFLCRKASGARSTLFQLGGVLRSTSAAGCVLLARASDGASGGRPEGRLRSALYTSSRSRSSLVVAVSNRRAGGDDALTWPASPGSYSVRAGRSAPHLSSFVRPRPDAARCGRSGSRPSRPSSSQDETPSAESGRAKRSPYAAPTYSSMAVAEHDSASRLPAGSKSPYALVSRACRSASNEQVRLDVESSCSRWRRSRSSRGLYEAIAWPPPLQAQRRGHRRTPEVSRSRHVDRAVQSVESDVHVCLHFWLRAETAPVGTVARRQSGLYPGEALSRHELPSRRSRSWSISSLSGPAAS